MPFLSPVPEDPVTTAGVIFGGWGEALTVLVPVILNCTCIYERLHPSRCLEASLDPEPAHL